MRTVSRRPKLNDQPDEADDLGDRAAGGGHGERDELAGVAGVRHREIGGQQVVLLVVGDLMRSATPRRSLVASGRTVPAALEKRTSAG